MKTQSFFVCCSCGLKTNRDAWCYNFYKAKVIQNIKKSLNFFNEQSKLFAQEKIKNQYIKVDDFICLDSTKISWDRQQKKDIEKNKKYCFNEKSIIDGLYRPFTKSNVYLNRNFNNCVYQLPQLFPTKNHKNIVIIVSGIGASKDFSTLITQNIPDLNSLEAGAHCFPLYYYEERKIDQNTLFEETAQDSHIRHDGISDFILKHARDKYGSKVTKEDIFYSVYGILHVPSYRELFAADLKKILPYKE